MFCIQLLDFPCSLFRAPFELDETGLNRFKLKKFEIFSMISLVEKFFEKVFVFNSFVERE